MRIDSEIITESLYISNSNLYEDRGEKWEVFVGSINHEHLKCGNITRSAIPPHFPRPVLSEA